MIPWYYYVMAGVIILMSLYGIYATLFFIIEFFREEKKRRQFKLGGKEKWLKYILLMI